MQTKWQIAGPDPNLSVLGGGLRLGEGSRGLGPGQSPGGGSGPLPPTDGKKIPVFEMPLEGSPLMHFVNFSSVLVLKTNNTLKFHMIM